MPMIKGRWRVPLAVVFVAALVAGAVGYSLLISQARVQGQGAAPNSDEVALLALVNEYRTQHGMWPLKLSPTLSAASRWMSEDMASHEYLSHTDSLGRDPSKRMADFGYEPSSCWGEVLSGADSPQAAFQSWRDSPQHEAIMLDAFLVAGVGKASNPQSPYRAFWTMDLRGYQDPVDASLVSPASSGTIVGCPAAGRWSMAVWNGSDDTPTGDALATCAGAPVAAAYWLDPQSQGWLRFLNGYPQFTNLTTLDNLQAVMLLGGEGP
jgi:uncharacterized protein YkwD